MFGKAAVPFKIANLRGPLAFQQQDGKIQQRQDAVGGDFQTGSAPDAATATTQDCAGGGNPHNPASTPPDCRGQRWQELIPTAPGDILYTGTRRLRHLVTGTAGGISI